MGRGLHFPLIVIAAAFLSGPARADDPAADLETQHQAAVAILNKPPISGVLITEVQPESAAAAAGMRGGDILTEYQGTRVTTLRGLTELVAEAVARRLEKAALSEHVTARVHRGERELTLLLPRDILGIRAVEVRAGVPGPRNPPPNPRGTLALDWKTVLQTLRAEGAEGPAAFRTFERTDLHPGAVSSVVEDWTGWELCTLKPEGEDALAGSIERFQIVSADSPIATQPALATERATFTFRLRLGDYTSLPAFLLEETSAYYPAPTGLENSHVVASATRRGDTLQALIGTATGDNAPPPAAGERHEIPAPLNAIPQAALPWVAAALPQSRGDALGMYLLSTRDLLPRPGYVLVTCGKQPLLADPAALDAPSTGPASAPGTAAVPAAWRVDLMLCGVVIESYWFSDQRRLLCVQTPGPQSIIARRVDNAKTAALPLERKPAKQNP
jgi:hypothetical protein